MIDHAKAYQQAMEGRHGQQLKLTELDAMGKDDPDFDPFKEMELDATALQQLEHQGDDDDAIIENEGIEEAEYKEIGAAADDDESDDSDSDDDSDDDEEEDEEDAPMYYRNDGSVPYKKSQLANFRAGAPAGGVFCVLELPGTQHKVTVDDVIVTERLKPVNHYAVGSVHTLTDAVLLVGSTSSTLVGMPYVTGAEVDVMVEEITQDAKVVIFKKRRKKNSQRRNGFRRDVTLLRVLDIRMPAGYNTDGHHVPRVEPMV